MKILKFGEKSLRKPNDVIKIRKIIESQSEACVVVISAFTGIRNLISETATEAIRHGPAFDEHLEEFKKRHFEIISGLPVNDEISARMMKETDAMASKYEDAMQDLYLAEALSAKKMDYLMSLGERLSAKLLSIFIPQTTYIDSRKLIRTDSNYADANVNLKVSEQQIQKRFENLTEIAILPGSVGSDNHETTTTLGKGGSEYTAAILAAAMDASVLEIWTDVDGFLTADPSIVEKAHPIKCLSYAEAIELSHFGSKMFYAPSLIPAFQKSIPIKIKNTFRPEKTGTLISKYGTCNNDPLIKGISSINRINLITVKGAAMIENTNSISRIFNALAKENVHVFLITQSSSEMTISFAVDPNATQAALKSLNKEFSAEIQVKEALEIEVIQDLSIIAIVGEQMRQTPGISAILFQSLTHNGISVIATAQGSSELNISVVIQKKYLKKALNAINEGFFLSDKKEMHLYLAGTGNVGKNLLNQIKEQQQSLIKTHRLKINLVGITNSRKMVIDPEGIDLNNVVERLDSGTTADIDHFFGEIRKSNLRNSLFIDCTASNSLADIYIDLFRNYVSVVTANKIACSSVYEKYSNLKKSALLHGVKFCFETNVGAGLPVISTIENLISSGDTVLELEAVVSGTLNYIFNVLGENIPLSKAVEMAMENGYAEPDPRLDLSGVDVKRKLLILARESGYAFENEDIQIEPFLPAYLFEGTVDSFLHKLKELDQEWETRRKALVSSGKRWKYVASLKDGKGNISLTEVDHTHPAYELEASNNIILITTSRYKELPLVIKGYGAGAEVTAAGVFADIIRAGNQ